MDNILLSPLGKTNNYVSEYDSSLLFPISRLGKRQEINIPLVLPFHGYDIWNAYEVSWLNEKGKPQVAIAEVSIDCHSRNILESKSFKLYLNSFNQTQLSSFAQLKALLLQDIEAAVQGGVQISLFSLEDITQQTISTFTGECLDEQDIACETYTTRPDFLSLESKEVVEETLYSHLLKSNCLVTGQPDWGSLQIIYKGPRIEREGLLRYIVSFRNHNEFHEQCVERIFMDITHRCCPMELTVRARYTRRGGLDINPVRSSLPAPRFDNIRMARQ